MKLSDALIVGCVAGCLALPSLGQAETMSGALVRAYIGNPDLNQQRAGVRAQDENLPRATSTWRPTATANLSSGYNYLESIDSSSAASGLAAARQPLPSWVGRRPVPRTHGQPNHL